jgi:hypothetical protein
MLSCISKKATSLGEKVLLLKNKTHTERTITHLCGAKERKNILAESVYRFHKYIAYEQKNTNFEGTEMHILTA